MSDMLFNCPNCNRVYRTKKGFDNHLNKMHVAGPIIDPVNHNIVSKAEEEQGWNKDQIELAMQLSMKDQYKEFIPDDEAVIEMSNAKLCLICASKKADVAFIECGHMIVCESCGNKLKNETKHNRKCPVCRKEIKKILKIYS